MRRDSLDFRKKTNEECQAWMKSFYQADAIDKAYLHSLWAWQEQQRRRNTEVTRLRGLLTEAVAWIRNSEEPAISLCTDIDKALAP